MKKGLACFLPWQLVSLAQARSDGYLKLGEQSRLPGREFITPGEAVIFPVPPRLNESLVTVLPLVALVTESIHLELDTLAGKA